MRDRNSPICTWRQNGCGDQRAKARKYTSLLPLNKIAALHVHGAFRGYARSRRALVVRDTRCHTAIHGMAVSDQDGYKSDHTLSFPFCPPHSWQSRRNHMAKADSTLRTVRAVPHPNKQLGQRWKETRCIRHGMPVSDQGWYRPVIPSRWSLAPQHLAKLP